MGPIWSRNGSKCSHHGRNMLPEMSHTCEDNVVKLSRNNSKIILELFHAIPQNGPTTGPTLCQHCVKIVKNGCLMFESCKCHPQREAAFGGLHKGAGTLCGWLWQDSSIKHQAIRLCGKCSSTKHRTLRLLLGY